MHPFRVIVPATSANLGPGFDLLGLAVPLYNELRFAAGDRLTITHTGPEAAGLPTDERHLAYRAAAALCAAIGQAVPPWTLAMRVRVPQSRGLGSSSAAIVAGLVGANTWFDSPLDTAALLQLATQIEGHPDNVAPALYGGVTAAWSEGDRTHCLPLADRPPASLVVAVPNFTLSTERARRALPDQYPRPDVVSNLAAVTVLTTVMLRGTVEWLPQGLRDRIHEPYRLPLIPGAEAVAASARSAGAWGVVISGAGPSLLAFTPAERSDAVAEAMTTAWQQAGIQARALAYTTLAAGARVEPDAR